ncbi:MAG: FkbM family methyltransferase [Bacteroidetes bacterium]|jgi:FkbM family methyltransferase|nr:FkbM family methyltransferase [Bacteroidota bacterium]
MILSRIRFSVQQRIFWSDVRRKRKEWLSLRNQRQDVIIKFSPDLSLKLYTDNELAPHIYCGAFEWAEREWLESALKPGMVFYDIGANIGFFSLIAAEKVTPHGHVYSFEPVTGTHDRLVENIQLNNIDKHVTTFLAAASNHAGEAQIYIPDKKMDAWNSLAIKPETSSYRLETIKTIVLDELVASNTLRSPDIIKIDVEGWELHVLRGLQQTLQKHHPTLFIEFTSQNLKAAGSSCTELADFIRALGYQLYEYDPCYKNLLVQHDFNFEHKNLIAKPAR